MTYYLDKRFSRRGTLITRRMRNIEGAWGAEALSLTETLTALGLTHRKEPGCKLGEHVVRDSAAKLTFIGTANDVWRWLHETGRITDV